MTPTQFGEGDQIEIVKLRPDGSTAATYNGEFVGQYADWIVVRAVWTFRRMAFDYLTFDPGDHLLEYFSTNQPFNAMALFTPQDRFKGWYCNITYPASVEDHRVYWHDLWIDIVQQADGTILTLDEDELSESGIERSAPELHRLILKAHDSVVEKMRNGSYPFSEIELPGH